LKHDNKKEQSELLEKISELELANQNLNGKKLEADKKLINQA
jgi:hypothetical protein